MHQTFLSLLASVGVAIVVAAPGQSQAANLTSLVSFCTLTNCADGLGPGGGLIADADGNLFGTTGGGGAHGDGTVFEIAKTARGYASTPRFWSASARWPTAPMVMFLLPA